MLDSLDMKEKDRNLIIEKSKTTNESQIVITHEKDTMTNMVKALGAKNLKKPLF